MNLNVNIADIGKLLETVSRSPGTPASVKTALSDLKTAVVSIEVALPDLAQMIAVDALNFGLEKVGLAALEPALDPLASAVVGEVEKLILAKFGLPLNTAIPVAATASASNAGTQSSVAAALDGGNA